MNQPYGAQNAQYPQKPYTSSVQQPVSVPTQATVTYQAVIPPGCYPGSFFNVNVGGATLRVQVPPGMNPGQQIAFQAPAAAQQQQPQVVTYNSSGAYQAGYNHGYNNNSGGMGAGTGLLLGAGVGFLAADVMMSDAGGGASFCFVSRPRLLITFCQWKVAVAVAAGTLVLHARGAAWADMKWTQVRQLMRPSL